MRHLFNMKIDAPSLSPLSGAADTRSSINLQEAADDNAVFGP